MIKKTVLIFSILMNIYTTQCSDSYYAQPIVDSAIDINTTYTSSYLKFLQTLKLEGKTKEYYENKKQIYVNLSSALHKSSSEKNFIQMCSGQLYADAMSKAYGG